MNVSLYQAASALNANARWQELIADNMANNSIPGFKKQDTSFAAVQTGLARTKAGGGFFMPRALNATNFLQGEVTATGSNTDLAVQGPGFLKMRLPDGTMAYTRNGKLRLDPNGQLTTSQGYPVMGENGPIQLNPRNPAFTIEANGDVSQDGDIKDKIALVDFNEPGLLTPIGASCFLANNPQVFERPATGATLQQGFLENSNASSLVEMGNLLTSMRQFESAQRVITMEDERMGHVISELGNPN
jgi:flagellar basal body rod protein FlgG